MRFLKKLYWSVNTSQPLVFDLLSSKPFQLVTFVVFLVTVLHKRSYSVCLKEKKKDVDENIFKV